MKKYEPVPLPKHWLTKKMNKKPFEFSSESAIGVLLGPLALIYLNPWCTLAFAVIDVMAIVLIQFMIKHSFFSLTLIIVSIVLLVANHYLCAWLRGWLIERRK